MFCALVETMKDIAAIRQKREAQHIKNRKKKGKEIEKDKDIKEVERHISIIKSPAAGLLEKRKLEAKVEEHIEDSDTEMLEADE
jgi:large subunit ribosomal protein L24e